MNRVRPLTIAALCVTEFAALGATSVPGTVGIPLRVHEVHTALSPEAAQSWVQGAGAITAMLVTPLFGWLSDFSVRRRGHRAPWVLGGALVGLVCVLVAARATSLPALVLAWVGAQVGYSALFAALFASIADFVWPGDRPRVAGIYAAGGFGAVAVGSTVAALLLGDHLGPLHGTSTSVFDTMAVVAVPAALFTAWHLRSLGRTAVSRPGGEGGDADAAPAPEPVARRSRRSRLRGLTGAGAPYWWLVTQRLLVQMSFSCLGVYAVQYVVRRTARSPHDAGQLVAEITAVGALLGMVVAGWVARRLARVFGYRVALTTGITLLLAGCVLLGVTTATPAIVAANLLAGVGLGIYLALDLVVALVALPPVTAGRLLGFFAAARKAPLFVVPAIGPALLAIGSGDVVGADRSHSYFALMMVGAGFAAIALLITPRLVVPHRDGAERRARYSLAR